MEPTIDVQTFESSSRKQTALALGCAAAGLVLAIASRGQAGPRGTTGLAGLLLGLFLLLLGAASFLMSGAQKVIVEPRARRITVEETDRLGTKRRSIAFDEVETVQLGYLGRASSRVAFHYLVLKLGSGEAYPLFSPGRFFDGGSDRAAMEERRRRLEELLAAPPGR